MEEGTAYPNPAGRPRKTLLTDALRDVLAEPYPRDEGRTCAEVIARRVANEAAKLRPTEVPTFAVSPLGGGVVGIGADPRSH